MGSCKKWKLEVLLSNFPKPKQGKVETKKFSSKIKLRNQLQKAKRFVNLILTRARVEKNNVLKTRGTIIKMARWHEQGKRNNNYFLNLEKRNHSRKLVSKLKLQNGLVITNQFDIFRRTK